jgi:hypothetical protein
MCFSLEVCDTLFHTSFRIHLHAYIHTYIHTSSVLMRELPLPWLKRHIHTYRHTYTHTLIHTDIFSTYARAPFAIAQAPGGVPTHTSLRIHTNWVRKAREKWAHQRGWGRCQVCVHVYMFIYPHTYQLSAKSAWKMSSLAWVSALPGMFTYIHVYVWYVCVCRYIYIRVRIHTYIFT